MLVLATDIHTLHRFLELSGWMFANVERAPTGWTYQCQNKVYVPFNLAESLLKHLSVQESRVV